MLDSTTSLEVEFHSRAVPRLDVISVLRLALYRFDLRSVSISFLEYDGFPSPSKDTARVAEANLRRLKSALEKVDSIHSFTLDFNHLVLAMDVLKSQGTPPVFRVGLINDLLITATDMLRASRVKLMGLPLNQLVRLQDKASPAFQQIGQLFDRDAKLLRVASDAEWKQLPMEEVDVDLPSSEMLQVLAGNETSLHNSPILSWMLSCLRHVARLQLHSLRMTSAEWRGYLSAMWRTLSVAQGSSLEELDIVACNMKDLFSLYSLLSASPGLVSLRVERCAPLVSIGKVPPPKIGLRFLTNLTAPDYIIEDLLQSKSLSNELATVCVSQDGDGTADLLGRSLQQIHDLLVAQDIVPSTFSLKCRFESARHFEWWWADVSEPVLLPFVTEAWLEVLQADMGLEGCVRQLGWWVGRFSQARMLHFDIPPAYHGNVLSALSEDICGRQRTWRLRVNQEYVFTPLSSVHT